jgi:hypothetical protein
VHNTFRSETAKDVTRQIAAVEPVAKVSVQGVEPLDRTGIEVVLRRDEEVDVALDRIEAAERDGAVQIDADEFVAEHVRDSAREGVEQRL